MFNELDRTLENHPNYNTIIQGCENGLKYLDYIKEHRLNVYKAFLEYSSKDEEFKNNKYALYNRILHHDLSKLDIDEFEGYRQKYVPCEDETTDEDVYQKSWERHYTTNSHHPEHHMSSTMDKLDILEMICDWEGVSYQFGGSAKEYYYSKKKQEMMDANLNVNYKYLEEHLLDTDKKGGEELQNLKFSIEDVNILQEVSDEQLAICEVYICANGNNCHDMPISLETIKEAAPTLLNKFLVADFNGFDFLDHTQTQSILGFFPKENDIRYVEKDGRTFLVANAILSKVYVPYAYKLFVEKNYKSVSMEITVLETKEIDGKENITKFVFNGVTVLGDRVEPAIESANIQVIKFSKDKLIEDGNKFYHDYQNKNNIRFDYDYVENVKKKYRKFSISEESLSNKPIESEKQEMGFSDIQNQTSENFSEGGEGMEDNKKDEIKEEKMTENEKQEESKEEVKEEQMSSNENVDGVAQAETLDEEAKENKEQAKEFTEEDPKESDKKDDKEEDKQEKMSYADLEMKYTESCGKYSDMEVQYAKLKEEHTVMMAEFESLKKFKCEYDEMQKKMAVEETMNYVADVIPETMSVEMREKGMKCSASELMAWSNEVKAKALEFAKPKAKKQQNTEPTFIRMGLSEIPQPNDIPNDSIWGKL